MRADIVDRLTDTLRDIAAERMQGLPVMNDSLRVEAVGFTSWAGSTVGVIIAPWFMNLVRLPGPDQDWNDLPEGSKISWELPSGDYEFTVARLAPVGVYQSCALFTSVLDFPDQRTARAVAHSIMGELLTDRRAAQDQPAERLPAGLQDNGLSRRELLRRTLGRS